MTPCYNCGNVSHFVADCPYEKREYNGGKLIRKDKTKSPMNKNIAKKKPQWALLVQDEYLSDDDDDQGSEVVEMTSISIITNTHPSTSLFDSPNKNTHIIHK